MYIKSLTNLDHNYDCFHRVLFSTLRNTNCTSPFFFFSACWVSLGVSIYNQLSSDMNYRIFKVHISNIYIYVIFFACAYTWGTLSHTKDLWSAQNLTLEKFQDVHKEN